jgi:protocatechuate 3,4-dioxygenase beta subunit
MVENERFEGGLSSKRPRMTGKWQQAAVLVTTLILGLAVSETAARGQARAAEGGKTASTGVGTVKEKETTCRVSGMVVRLSDGMPLKNATVQLENEEDHEHTIATKTGADGRFALKNVPPARYKLKIRRNGYVDWEYGQRKPSDPGAAFTLAAGEERRGLLFKLIPGAVISGRIFDEDGEAFPNAVVMASREVYVEGKRKLQSRVSARTDDLGQYRVFALDPGRYLVSAISPDFEDTAGDRDFAEESQKKGETGYARTYYPGTADSGKSSPILLKEGEEAPGVDIQLKQTAVYRVSGKIYNAITHKGALDAYVGLLPAKKSMDWDFNYGGQIKKTDGSFELARVIPGPYRLIAFWSDQGKAYSTQERVEVGESDISGLQLTIGTGATVTGRVHWDGKPSLDRDALTVVLQRTEMAFAIDSPARVDTNQHFTLQDIGDGDYDVVVQGMSKDCYISDVEYGGTHSADNSISVSKGGGATLEVTISSRGARVQGAVTDKDGLPAPGVWVVAVPEGAHRTNYKLFKAQTTDQYGKYDLRGLIPGSYKIFSWTGIEPGEWQDPDFLQPQESKGELLDVKDDDIKMVSLKVIERKSQWAE